MRNENMVKEAVRRMKMIGLRDFKIAEDEIIRVLDEKGEVFVSCPFLTNQAERLEWAAVFRPLGEGEQKLVDEFEEQSGALVYHVIRNTNPSEIGNCYAFLYVSKEEDKWSMARSCLENMDPYTGRVNVVAYVVNVGQGYVRGDETELHGVGEITSIEIEKPYASSIRPPSALLWSASK